MKYIALLAVLLVPALMSAQTPSLFGDWSPAIMGSKIHITISEHEVIAKHQASGLISGLPQFLPAPMPEGTSADKAIERSESIMEKSDTAKLLKVVYDSAKAKGRLFIEEGKSKNIMVFSFLLHDDGEMGIGIAMDPLSDFTAKKKTLKELEKASRNPAKHSLFGFGNIKIPLYNSARTAEFAKLKEPQTMPKSETMGMIKSFGDRMAAALQQLPEDTSFSGIFGMFGPMVKNGMRIVQDLFITHGYNPLAAGAMFDTFKDDSDLKAAVELAGNKIEESVPMLREEKARREKMKKEQGERRAVTDSVMHSSDLSAPPNSDGSVPPPAPAVDLRNDKYTVAKQEPVKEEVPDRDEFIDVTQEPKPLQNVQALIKYPEDARKDGLEGKVMYSVLIGKDGRAQKVEIVKSDNVIFNQSVIDAVMKVRFKPALQNDKPVRVWYTQSVSFKLGSGE